jgi:hypothetical protein
MDRHDPKWRRGAEAEAYEAMRGWMEDERRKLLRLLRLRARLNDPFA